PLRGIAKFLTVIGPFLRAKVLLSKEGSLRPRRRRGWSVQSPAQRLLTDIRAKRAQKMWVIASWTGNAGDLSRQKLLVAVGAAGSSQQNEQVLIGPCVQFCTVHEDAD